MKHRTDEEVLDLLEKQGVPEDLTLKMFYAQVHAQVAQSVQQALRRGGQPLNEGQVCESFAKTFGFTHWMTLRYLLRRRQQIRKRQAKAQAAPAQVAEPEGLTPSQKDYLKKLRYRKAEVVTLSLVGRNAIITHRTGTGNLVTYEVSPRGNTRYLPSTSTG